MADKIQLRRDTAARWQNYNPILSEGEPGFETDTDQYKIGDGVSTWNQLPYRGFSCLNQFGNSKTSPLSQFAASELSYLSMVNLQWYGDARIYLTSSNKLQIIGNVPSAANNAIVRFYFRGVIYKIYNTVTERTLTIVGNSQILIPINTVEPAPAEVALTLDDLVEFAGTTYNSNTHIKISHILFGGSPSGPIIKPYSEYGKGYVDGQIATVNTNIENAVRASYAVNQQAQIQFYGNDRRLVFEPSNRTLMIVGTTTDTSQSTKLVWRFILPSGQTIRLLGTVETLQIPNSSGNIQVLLPIPPSDVVSKDLTLEDLVFQYNNVAFDYNTYFKIGHIILDVPTGGLIMSRNDWRLFYGDLSFQKNLNSLNITNNLSGVQYYGTQRIVFDRTDNKLKVRGTSSQSPNIVRFNFLNFIVTIQGTTASEKQLSINGNCLLALPKPTASVNYTLDDILELNTATFDPNVHIRIGHIIYLSGVSLGGIIVPIEEYNSMFAPSQFPELHVVNTLSGIQYYTNNQRLCYDAGDKKLKFKGSGRTDHLCFRFEYKGVQILLLDTISEKQLTINGNCEVVVPVPASGVTQVQYTLNDVIELNTASLDTSRYIRLAQIIFLSGVSKGVIMPIEEWNAIYNSQTVDASKLGLIYQEQKNLQWYGEARFYLDASTKTINIKGSISNDLGTNLICRFMISTGQQIRMTAAVKTYVLINNSGNCALCLPLPPVGTTTIDYSLSDIVEFNTVDDYDSTKYVKIAHIIYGKGVGSAVILQDFSTNATENTFLTLTSYGSAINNNFGENAFAQGMKPNLKILGYSNSFMRNSVHFLSSIANGAGVNLTVGNLYTGGTNLINHLNALINNSAVYEWHKYVDGTNPENLSGQTPTYGLMNERWDAIILHQYLPWDQPFEPTLNLFMKKIIEVLGYCPKFYLNATWAGRISGDATDYYGFETEEEMWQAMLTLTEQAGKDSGIMNIIPTGTAIQNARTLPFADDAAYNRYVNNNNDEHHLNIAGGFLASCAIYEKIVYPLNKIHCSNSTFRLTSQGALPPSNIVMPALVTDENFNQFCNAAIKAVEKPNEITNIS